MNDGIESETVEGVRVSLNQSSQDRRSTASATASTSASTLRSRALREYRRKHRGGINALLEAARADRVYA